MGSEVTEYNKTLRKTSRDSMRGELIQEYARIYKIFSKDYVLINNQKYVKSLGGIIRELLLLKFPSLVTTKLTPDPSKF